ncbi:UvrD-helicase domain-containing protein [Burkholderia cenocepacia]|uniref:UvrD-helicase domain-containing protein n=1 Tax=Burkholderia cenocepacia TaxID=95486 RepID=UPI001CF5B7FD|nr:UvrD-helicase domain-containing protein [Burkholderia cenocepacia]MCA8010417.1 UvrD-helicase domain-containing protein [Burkholderia cenocepacia]
MSAVKLQPEDLAELAKLAKDLNFDDIERRGALLESESRDFNAVPGSGKTSLLAAKLLLLAKKWPHTRRGICVLSHTNVARDEIARRLAETADGAQLLSYPHYIGTIHSFVNHFFAMPILRSLEQKVDVIDDDVFADKARARLQLGQFTKLRYFLGNQNNGDDIVTTLFYRTAELAVQVEKGALPATHTPSYHSLVSLKAQLTKLGIFRHRDMFAYSDLALKTCPHLVDVVHRRFPMVFIDEMQDTSWDQESFLNRIFDGKSVMQRFGDVDQKILLDEENADRLTFPRQGHGCISTSKRFGDAIARAVASVRMSGDAVVGEGTSAHAPILLLYATDNAPKVIQHFGKLIISRLSTTEVSTHNVKAMCARKTGEGNVDAGRHLRDYWPAYGVGLPSTGTRSENFWGLVGDAGTSPQEASLSARVSDVRRGLLLVLRDAGSPLAKDIRDGRALPRAASAFAPAGRMDALTRQLALSGEQLCSVDQRAALFQLLYDGLKPYLPNELEIEAFKALSVFDEPGDVARVGLAPAVTTCHMLDQGRSLQIDVGTVASMKGETHSASLVLESYGGISRKFDVALGLEYIAGIPSKALAKLPKTQQAQMRNLYVAMSRPTSLLCLAANESRVPQKVCDALAKKGWQIQTVA